MRKLFNVNKEMLVNGGTAFNTEAFEKGVYIFFADENNWRCSCCSNIKVKHTGYLVTISDEVLDLSNDIENANVIASLNPNDIINTACLFMTEDTYIEVTQITLLTEYIGKMSEEVLKNVMSANLALNLLETLKLDGTGSIEEAKNITVESTNKENIEEAIANLIGNEQFMNELKSTVDKIGHGEIPIEEWIRFQVTGEHPECMNIKLNTCENDPYEGVFNMIDILNKKFEDLNSSVIDNPIKVEEKGCSCGCDNCDGSDGCDPRVKAFNEGFKNWDKENIKTAAGGEYGTSVTELCTGCENSCEAACVED